MQCNRFNVGRVAAIPVAALATAGVSGQTASQAPYPDRWSRELYEVYETVLLADSRHRPRLQIEELPTRDVALVDVDGDQDLDAFILDGTEEPTWDGVPRLPLDEHHSLSVELFDIDADGDLDAFVGNGYQVSSDPYGQLLINNGHGYFSDAFGDFAYEYDEGECQWIIFEVTAIATSDLDGDDDLDMVLATGGWANPFYRHPNLIFLNENGELGAPAIMPGGETDGHSVSVGDIDEDQDTDLLFGDKSGGWGRWGSWPDTNKVWKNTGPELTFVLSQELPEAPDEPGFTFATELGDFDGDGDLDIFEANARDCWDPPPPNEVGRFYLNDGNGVFVDAPEMLAEGMDNIWSVASGDLDNDGDLDLVVGRPCEGVFIYLNDPDYGFEPAAGPLAPVETHNRTLTLGDVDSDGDLDLFASGQGYAKNKLYRNNGHGGFFLIWNALPADEDWTLASAMGDVDGDGDLDILVANYGRNRLYLNDGSGFFWCPWDLNGDGNVDHRDILIVVHNMGPCDGCPEDLNGDGVVNGRDVAAVARHFGPCP
jgi:hypothetical protein